METNKEQQLGITIMGKPRGGRPKMSPEDRKIPVYTTLSPAQIRTIDANRWKYNELIADGIAHRLSCAATIKEQTDKIARLAEKIQDQARELESLKTTEK